MKKRQKNKHFKPPPQEAYQSAEDFLENGVDAHLTRMKSSDEENHIYTIRKDGEKEGTLCRIDNVVNWSVGKTNGKAPETGPYKVKKNGNKIVLAKFRPR